MQFRLIAVGTKMPDWISTGFAEYAKRLPSNYALSLHEISAEKRTKNSDITKLTEREGAKILEFSKPSNVIVALDVLGQSWTTEKLADHMRIWHEENRVVDILIGGPDGLAPACLQKANFKLSLSAMTFPHPIVRIVIAEQIYRAWSILQNHPYHRA